MDVSWEEFDEEMCLSIERMIEKTKNSDPQVRKPFLILSIFVIITLDIVEGSVWNVTHFI
jgi:hypothetical protein